MDIETYKTLAYLLAAMIAAAMLVAKFRHLFDRRPGEDWRALLQRAVAEKEQEQAAQQLMFGSRGATIRAQLVVFGCSMAALYLAFVPGLLLLLVIYFGTGLFVSRKPAKNAKGPDHERLSTSDRILFRLYFACTWPLHINR